MERALEIWKEEELPPLALKSPWYGYALGLWNAEDDAMAEAIARGEPVVIDPSTGPPAMAGGHSLGIAPENRGVVLSERRESKDDGSGAPGLPGGLHEKLKG
jgi:hypothetical protein